MPPSLDDRLIDIRDSIAEIEATLAAMTRQDFLAQRPKRLITERLLEIVCEASRRLPDDLKRQNPKLAWREIIDFGNLLRHAYRSTKADLVWDIVQNELPALKAFVEHQIEQKIDEPIKIETASVARGQRGFRRSATRERYRRPIAPRKLAQTPLPAA